MWYMCTMEYYSAIKKNEIMPSTATWRDLEIAILPGIANEGTRLGSFVLCRDQP